MIKQLDPANQVPQLTDLYVVFKDILWFTHSINKYGQKHILDHFSKPKCSSWVLTIKHVGNQPPKHVNIIRNIAWQIAGWIKIAVLCMTQILTMIDNEGSNRFGVISN